MTEAQEDRAHDASYRKLFGYPEILRELLEGFVPRDMTGTLEFAQMERLETTFIAAALVRRQADMLWKIPRAGDGPSLYLYVLMEFQSRSDPLMPIRMMVYIGLIYEHLGRQDSSALRRGGLPPSLPIVLYNGAAEWSAQRSAREMIGLPSSAALSYHQPELRLYLIDEGRLGDDTLDQPDSVLACLFLLEHAEDPAAIHKRGRLDATRELLRKLMTLKFGEDADRAARVEALSPEQLELAVQRILVATDEADLFA